MAYEYDTPEALARWVAWKYMTEELSWTASKVAFELDLNEEKFIAWVNGGAAVMNRRLDQNQGKVRDILRDLMKKYPAKATAPDTLPTLNVAKVVEAVMPSIRDEKPIDLVALAKHMKVNTEVFRAWYEQNLGEINVRLRQAQKAAGVMTR